MNEKNNDINQKICRYLVIAVSEQKASFSVREAGSIVVGKELTGHFIMAELSTFLNITYSTDILHKVIRMGHASNIDFRTSYG